MPGSTAQADNSTTGKTVSAVRERRAQERDRFPVSIRVFQAACVDASFNKRCDA
jgi:hypothetical protein